MNPGSASDRHEFRVATYVGAAVTAIIAFVSHPDWLFFLPYLLGPLAGVLFATRYRRQKPDFTNGATIGFFSVFYGMIAAVGLGNIASHFVREQLWQVQNIYRILPLVASKGIETNTVADWYSFMLEITLIAIIAGALGAPSGVLGVRLFSLKAQQKRSSRQV
jgi:hypothetical protein